jgi:poly-gamma-glutamate capsule biosynthesis protein CapA/YwtB (metallophosphatase superfamily)
MVPLQIRNMRLCRASLADAQWLEATLKREGDPFGTHVRLGADNALRLEW